MARLTFLGHPLHPAVVHAPLALLLVVPGWDVIAWIYGAHPDGAWWTVAYWTGIAGVVLAVPAFITGFIDLLAVPAALMALAVTHMLVMGLVVLAFLLSMFLLHTHGALPFARYPLAALMTDVMAAVALLAGGWLGGQLVYGHGVGVRTAPTASGSAMPPAAAGMPPVPGGPGVAGASTPSSASVAAPPASPTLNGEGAGR